MMFWRKKREQDLDRELRQHLELEAEERNSQAEACATLGNLTLIKEDVREAWGWMWLDRLAQDARYTARVLRRSPGFTAVAMLSLALGIGANTAIFSLIDAVRLRSLPVPKPRELARVQIRGGIEGWGISNGNYELSAPLFHEIRDRQQAFSGIFAWDNDESFPIGSGIQARVVRGLSVSGNLFETLGIPAAAGRLFTPDDDQPGCAAPGVVLSYGMWQREFGGNRSVIGKRLTVLGHPFEVVGVAPAFFTGLEVGKSFDIALPICANAILDQGPESPTRRDVFWLTVMGRLKPGWNMAQASDHLYAISPGLMEATLPSGYGYGLELYRGFRLEAIPAGTGVSGLRDSYAAPLWLLLGITALVLLIACANVANLMLARASTRSREVALRLAMGASRGRILLQSLCESAVLGLGGAACGVALAQALSRTIVAFLSTENDTVFLDLSLDWRVFAFAAAVAIAGCLIFGLIPVIRALRIEPGSAAQSAGRATAAGAYRFSAQRSLIVGQVSLSLVLIVSALLFVHSFRNLVTLNPGFREKGILEANLNLIPLRLAPTAIKPLQQALLEEIRSVPGVEAAGITSFRLLVGGSWTLIVQSASAKSDSKFTWVSPGYFETLEIPILAGRNFDSDDRQDSPKVVIVNQTFARRFFPDTNPIGKTFRNMAEPNYPETDYQIIGISKDTKYASLREGTPPVTYAPASQDPNVGPWLSVYIRSSATPAAVIAGLKRRLGKSHPEVMAQFSIYQEQIQSGLTRERLMAALSGFFGVLATILASVGLYGVVAYIVIQRRAEIGIRMALGADRWRVIAMVMREIGLLLAAGVAIGAAGALALGRSAQSLLFGLSAHDPATFAIAVAVLMAVAALGSFLPARRAAKVDPMVTLRCE